MARDAIYARAGGGVRRLHFGQVVSVFSSGSHHPLLCFLDDDHGPAGQWVVKPQHVLSASRRRQQMAVLAEIVGAQVCVLAGVPSPMIGVVRIPSKPTEEHIGNAGGAMSPAEIKEVQEVLEINAGTVAFCAKFLTDAVNVDASVFTTESTKAQARTSGVRLLLVDAFLRHNDRRVGNPNAMWHDGQLVAIDNGDVLVGLEGRDIAGPDLAAQIVIQNHFKDQILADVVQRWARCTDWLAAVKTLSNARAQMQKLASTWPTERDHDTQNECSGLRGRARDFLTARVSHLPEIAANLFDMVGGCA